MFALSSTPDLFSSLPMQAASEKRVGKSDYSIESTVRSDGTVVQERVIAFMRARYPVWTAKRVAADTGISPGTIIKWLDRGSAPSAAHMWRLGCAYGLAFLAAIYVEVDAVEAARRADELAALEARVAALRGGAR